MKVALLILLALVLTLPLSAQLKTHGVAFGGGAGATLGNTDFGTDEDPGIFGQAYLRHAIFGPLEGQIGGALRGKISRSDANRYETFLSTLDYRLLLRPFATRYFSPYLSAGFGGLFYQVEQSPAAADPSIESEAWVTYVPLGGGFQIRIVEGISVDLSGGYGMVFSDDLNLVRSAEDDGFYMAGIGLTVTGREGSGDRDRDGIIDRDEERLGTNKKEPDSDFDGLTDYEELYEHKTHPMQKDTDSDGIDDKEEVLFYKTNPRKADTDGDGLLDYEEVNRYKTNPLQKDSDGDRLSDGDEVKVSKTDPANKDMDNDGLSDGEEMVNYKTDPRNADSDDDGLRDGKEVLVHKTDPANPDTDGDRLSDGEEVNLHKTDPLVADSDGGGTLDGEEVIRGTDPLDEGDDAVLLMEDVGSKVVLEGIIFASGSATISEQSELILEKALNTLVTFPEMEVEIQGHTDNTGSRSLNLRLSQRRAESVRTWLVRRGVDGGRIVARGYGPDRPIAENATAAGRARNRRVEFVRIK